MLELFSRQPDNFEMPQDAQLTPIPMDEEVSSLSAILLDGEYYQFIQNNYSPKALSRIDIYRQTRNQFAMLKSL